MRMLATSYHGIRYKKGNFLESLFLGIGRYGVHQGREGFQTWVKLRRWLIGDVIPAEPLSNTDHNIITFTLPGV